MQIYEIMDAIDLLFIFKAIFADDNPYFCFIYKKSVLIFYLKKSQK